MPWMVARDYKYVLLGGGNSAGYAAREFVKRGGPKGELAIITDEPYVAYERPALSKAYLFPEGFARLPGFHACVGGGGDRQEPAWYTEHGIEYLTSTKVVSADVASKTLTTAAGDTITYEKLIIGTGARPVSLADFKTPGADLSGVFYLRNVQDADVLLAAIKECKAAGGKAVCIGGGYIGMECAAGLAMQGLDVTMVFPESRLMERLFTPELAAFYEGYYAEKGIKILKGDLAVALEGSNGKVAGVRLKSGGQVEASLVLVGVGARPNVELFKGQLDLLEKAPGGIKVNSRLQTSDPDVYAVGDVAAFPLKLTGAVTRQEHVTNSRLTGAYAVGELLAPGTQPEYDYLPFFYSRVFSLSWQFYGLGEGEVVLYGDRANGSKFGAYWVKEGQVVGAFLESGSPEEFAGIKKVAQAQPAAPVDLAQQGLGFASKL
ncbi:hypothetical protein N2152v2_010840 [Parachlorella kessleri]